LSRYSQYSPILRRSRKLSCKKGRVDRRVSRRERDIPNTFIPTPCPSRGLASDRPQYYSVFILAGRFPSCSSVHQSPILPRPASSDLIPLVLVGAVF